MSRVVIFMDAGTPQGVLTDSVIVDVLILDRDIEGIEKDDPSLREFDGEIYYVGHGVDLVDPDYVNAIFRVVDA